MDFVWSRATAETVRDESIQALRRQADNMRETVQRYRDKASEISELAETQRIIEREAMRIESWTNSQGIRSFLEVPDLERRMEARQNAEVYEEQAEALTIGADELEEAIEVLEDAIRAILELFANMHDDALFADGHAAREFRRIIEGILAFTGNMASIRDGIGHGFPLDLRSVLTGLSTLDDIQFIQLMYAMSLAGTPIFCMFGLDPVNMSTGNFIYTKEDISVHGRYPLEVKRFYNSIGVPDGEFGLGWTHNYVVRLSDKG
jgi:hypothetical protein